MYNVCYYSRILTACFLSFPSCGNNFVSINPGYFEMRHQGKCNLKVLTIVSHCLITINFKNMGFDITYHPIKEYEIQQLYFNVLHDISLIEKLAAAHHMDTFHKEKYEDIILLAKEAEPTELFDSCHGRYISVVQGFFRTYFYTRGSAFSFLMDRDVALKKYTKGWKDIVMGPIENPVQNKITENYSSGVFFPADQVGKLLDDYHSDSHIKKELNDYYSNERISVFIRALDFSKQHNMGLLEAAEVVEPNPLKPNDSLYYSNRYNCDQEGVFLYVEEVMKKIRAAEDLERCYQKHGIRVTDPDIPRQPEEEVRKKGFWKRLFG